MRLVLPCPMEEDSGMLMSVNVVRVYSTVITFVGGKEGKRGQWGLGVRTKNGAVDSEQGASKGRGPQLRTKSHYSK
jgi:hypothetical protein